MDILQLLGTIGIGTLGIICTIISRDKGQHLLLVSGQVIFKWLSPTLLVIAITRGFSFLDLLSLDIVKSINSTIFLISVIGITWSVSRHARKRTN